MKEMFTKKKITALLIIILLIAQMFSPYSILLKKSYAAVDTTKPLLSVVASEVFTKGTHKLIKVTYAVTGENVQTIDLSIGFDSTKIAPANKKTGAAFTTTNIGNTATSCADYGTLTGYFDVDAHKYTPASSNIRMTMSHPDGKGSVVDLSAEGFSKDDLGAEETYDHDYYMDAFSLYFYLVDESITELTTDMLYFEPVGNGMPTGFKYIYNNGSTDITVLNLDNVSYDGGFAVESREIVSISVKTPPTKTTYEHGDAIDYTGGEIEVTYDSGEPDTVSMTEAAVVKTSGDPADVNDPNVGLEYHGKTTSFPITVTDPVDSLAVTTPMNDIDYNEGENFDFTGLTLTATKRSGATVPLTQSSSGVTTSELTASVNSPNFTQTSGSTDVEKKGNQKITFTYEGKTADTSVIVNDKIDHIDLISQPTKQVYKRGEAINLSGAVVQVTLQSGDTTNINLPNGTVTVGSYNPTLVGSQQSLSVRVNTFTSPTNIKAEAYNYVTSVTATPPSKEIYKYGQSLALSGGSLKLTWQAGTGTPVKVNLTDADVSVTGYDPTVIGTQTLTATYNAKYTLSDGTVINDSISDTFDVEVTNPITNIAITPPTKTAYKHGESLSLTGGQIEVTYENGTKTYPTLTAAMITESDGTPVVLNPAVSAYTPNNPISKTLLITYSQDGDTQTANYPITLENNITTIGMSQNPTKLTYNLGDTTYDQTGGEVLVSYAAGNSDLITLPNADVTLTPLNTLTTSTGTKTVQVSYKGKTTGFNITVQNGVTGITITPPTDILFDHGDTLTFNGGNIAVANADGTTTNHAITSAMVTETATGAAVSMTPAATDYDTTTHDLTKNLTITYTEGGITQTATYNIKLKNPVDSIAITTNPKSSYNLGETPTYPDGDILATRKAGDTEPVDIVASMVTGLNTSVAGTGKTATVTYEGKTATYNYNVIDNVTSITITAPTTVAYNHGDSINFTGSDIDVEYASGSHSHPTMTTAMITEAGGGALNMSPASTAYDANYELSKALTITYTENGVTQTAPYNITLTNNVTGIAMGTNPTDTAYNINDATYKLAGGDIVVTRAAGNNHTVALTDSGISLSPINTITNSAGTKSVTVTYEGKTTSFNVTVSNAIDTITITAPTDVTFNHGDTLTFNGGNILVSYLDGTSANHAITSTMVTEAGSAVNMSPAAADYNATTHDLTKTLTITYTEDSKTETKDYTITLKNPIDSLTITTAPKNSYNLNESTTGVGGDFTVTRKAGDTDPTPIAILDSMVTGLDTTSAGTGKTATLSYTEDGVTTTTTYTYDVIDNVTSIVITPPTKATYNHGEGLDITGGTITVNYAGGSSSTPSMTTAMITEAGSAPNMSPVYADYTNNQCAKTLTITYTENGVTETANYPITIVNNVTGIAMKNNPTDTTYGLNDTVYKLAGGDIEVSRAVGPTEIVALIDSGISLTPLSSLTNTSGLKVVQVTYEGQTTSFGIQVQDAVSGISLAGTPKTVYELNEAIDPTLSINVVRPSGTTTIPVTSTMISGFTTATEGNKSALITYEGKTVTYSYSVVDDALSIAMGTTPKTNYLVGETLDVTGGTITVSKKSGATETVNITPTMVSGFSSSSVVTGKTLTVTYNGLTTTYQINVTNPVSSITLNPEPTKKTYKYGETLSLVGGSLDVVFESGATDTIALADSMISGFDPTILGNQIVTVTYGKNSAGADVTTSYNVNVQDYVTGITVTGEKNSYNYGEVLDLTQGTVNVTMASGTPAAPVALNDASVTVSGYSPTTTGNQTLTVTLGTQSTTYTVNVTDYVTSKSIVVPTKTTYNYGDSLDLSTGKIVKTMASGATQNDPLTLSMVTEADGSAVNMTPASFNATNKVTKTLKITSDGITENYQITIVNDVTSIVIKQTPKKDYNYGDSQDTSVGSIEVTRGDGSKEEIPLSDSRISFEGFDTTTPGNNIPVKVKFTENGITKQTNYPINVNDNITSIQLVGTPKTAYKYGESLNLSGLTLTVVRPSGTTPNVPVTANMVSGYNPNTLGNQTITITYGDKTATYTVNVADYLKDVQLVKPNKLSYKKGETLDLTGASITEVMASGAKVTGIPVTPDMVSALDTTTEGTKTLTVTYVKGGTTYRKQFAVVVTDGLSGISVKNFPNDEYNYGEGLDLTGATIEVELESGETQIVPITKNMVQGYTSKPTKDKFDDSDECIELITITYTKDGKTETTTYPITVKDYLNKIVVEGLQKEYRYGENLNVTGATVAKVMASGATKDKVQLTKDMVSGYNPKQEGNQSLTISYAGKTAKETVKVVDDIIAISLKKIPNKTTFDYGTSLDVTGGQLNVTRYSGTTTIDMTNSMVSGYDSSKPGTQTLKVKYAGFETEYSVKVLEKKETPVADDKKDATPSNSTTPTQTQTQTKYITKYVTVYRNEVPQTEEPKTEQPTNVIVQVPQPEQPEKTEEQKPTQTTKPSNTEKPTQTLGVKDEQKDDKEKKDYSDIIRLIAKILAGLGLLGLLILLLILIFKRNVKVYVIEDKEEGFILGGLDKISKKNPKLDIDRFLDKETYPNEVKVHLNDSISEKLDGVEIEITHRGKKIKHTVHYNDEPYEFILAAKSEVETPTQQ